MKKGDLEKVSLFTIIAVIFIALFLFLKPEITGFVVYSPGYYNWTFDSDDYTYDSDLIEITDGVRLKLQEEEHLWTTINSTEFYITSAYYNGDDKTEKVQNVDNKKQTVKNKVLDVIFDNSINNGDIIALYLNEESECNVYLCNTSVSCDGDYGSFYFPNTEGWYNLSINNLESPVNSLGISTDDEIKVNYVKVIREWEEENSEIIYSYPESASIETKNIDLPTVNQLNLFSKNEELNGQEINYYYSVDNGENWNEIPENGSLPYLNEIKLKAELNSNTENTPILYNMVLTYEYCEENWNCSEWSKCYENGTRARYCNDLNECETEEDKPIEIEDCIYFPGYYDVNGSKTISLKVNESTVVNASDLVLDIISEEDVVDVNMNIEKGLGNLTTISGKNMMKNVNISANGLNLKEAIIKIYYNEEDLVNVDEDGLKIYYYNDGIWEELNSSVNKEENYVYANVEHFSVYGVFGDVKEETSSGSGSSGGGGGSSSFRRPESGAEQTISTQPVIEKKNENGANEVKNTEIIEEVTPLRRFTGLVTYNAKKSEVSVPVGLGILILMIAFFIRAGKFNRKKR